MPLLNTSDWNRTHQGPMCAPGITERVFSETAIPRDELMAFTPCKLFRRIRGRTLWFLGDSQSNRFRQTTAFFLRDYATAPLNVATGAVLNFSGIPEILTYIPPRTAGNPPRMYRPVCVDMIDSTRVCEINLMKGDPTRLSFIFEFLNRNFPDFSSDIVIFNYGLHFWTTNSTLSNYLANFAEYRMAIKQSGSWDMPLTVWADTLPRHFSTPTGAWQSGGDLEHDTCQAHGPQVLGTRGPHNAISDPFVANISDLHLRLWELASPHWSAHFKPGDCTHFCRPSVQELSVFQLYRLLQDGSGRRFR
jgi:hypothetical protein